jgi:bacillopeptidase F
MSALMLISALVFSGIIHPQLQEKLNSMKDYAMIEAIVHMKNRPILAQLPIGTTNDEKIQYLKEFCQVDQADLLDYLAEFPNQVSDIQSFWIFNGLCLKATNGLIQSIASRTDVDYVIDNFTIMLDNPQMGKENVLRTPEWNIQKIKADSCWSAGYDGSGLIVGNIDTGVDTSHPALQGKFYPGGWYDAINGQPDPYDDQGHGTRMMGIVCGGDGNGPFVDDIGVAPGIQFMAAKG